MALNSKRNGKIELLRFIMCIIVVIHHSYVINPGDRIFTRGSLAVEFFFLVSGYLMALKCSKGGLDCSIGKDTSSFIIKKYCSLQPSLIITEIIALIVCFFAKPLEGIKDFCIRVFGMLFENSLIQFSGFKIYDLNPVTWYLSTMLLAMLVLYPLCRKYFDVFSKIIAPFLGLMIIGILYLKYKSQMGPFNKVFDDLFYKGLIRAFAEICLGVVAFNIAEWIRGLNLTAFSKAMISIIELAFYAVTIVIMTIETTKYDTVVLFLMLIAVSFSFSQAGICSKLFNNKFFCFLGSLSLPIYLSHYFWLKFINTVFDGSSFEEKMTIYLVLAFSTALIVYLLSNILRKNSNIFKKIFIKSEKLN